MFHRFTLAVTALSAIELDGRRQSGGVEVPLHFVPHNVHPADVDAQPQRADHCHKAHRRGEESKPPFLSA
jgi:hypothetical protein